MNSFELFKRLQHQSLLTCLGCSNTNGLVKKLVRVQQSATSFLNRLSHSNFTIVQKGVGILKVLKLLDTLQDTSASFGTMVGTRASAVLLPLEKFHFLGQLQYFFMCQCFAVLNHKLNESHTWSTSRTCLYEEALF